MERLVLFNYGRQFAFDGYGGTDFTRITRIGSNILQKQTKGLNQGFGIGILEKGTEETELTPIR
jgi:hypothetical protein